jgi:hypothetical protein
VVRPTNLEQPVAAGQARILKNGQQSPLALPTLAPLALAAQPVLVPLPLLLAVLVELLPLQLAALPLLVTAVWAEVRKLPAQQPVLLLVEREVPYQPTEMLIPQERQVSMLTVFPELLLVLVAALADCLVKAAQTD